MRACWSVLCVVVVACGGSKEDKSNTKPAETKPAAPAQPIALPAAVPPPFEVAPPTDAVVDIGRGVGHACVVRASGAVDCWGQPKDTEARRALHDPGKPVWRVEGITDATAIDARARCVVRKS